METRHSPKKILFVITKSYFGGAQRYVFDLACHFKDAGDDVTVLVGGKGLLTEKLSNENIPVISLPYLERDVNPITDLRALLAFMRALRQVRPDVLHVNSAKAGGLGAVAGRLLFVPRIIFTAHGFAFNEDRSVLSKLLIKAFTWLTIALAHETIAVSNALRTQVPAILRRKVRVVRNSVQPMSFVSREAARAFLSEKCPGLSSAEHPETFWIATIAELHPIKGLLYALRAMAALKNDGRAFRYVIMGDGDLRTELSTQIIELGLSEQVFLAGFVPDASAYLRAFDAFLLPSLSEGLAYVLLEAGSAPLPAVATNVGGIPEIITDSENGLLIPPRDEKAIFEAIRRLMDDSSLSRDLSQHLRETVIDSFAATTMFSGTDEVYGGRFPTR